MFFQKLTIFMKLPMNYENRPTKTIYRYSSYIFRVECQEYRHWCSEVTAHNEMKVWYIVALVTRRYGHWRTKENQSIKLKFPKASCCHRENCLLKIYIISDRNWIWEKCFSPVNSQLYGKLFSTKWAKRIMGRGSKVPSFLIGIEVFSVHFGILSTLGENWNMMFSIFGIY